MADPNLHDFYGRLTRIEKAHRGGYGFEADGTLGRSHYTRPARRGFPVVRTMVMVVCVAMALKGIIHYSVGAATYEQRVQSLELGEGFDRLGAALMHADPVTLFLSSLIREGVAWARTSL